MICLYKFRANFESNFIYWGNRIFTIYNFLAHLVKFILMYINKII